MQQLCISICQLRMTHHRQYFYGKKCFNLLIFSFLSNHRHKEYILRLNQIQAPKATGRLYIYLCVNH